MKFDKLVKSILNEASYHQDAIDAAPSHDSALKDLVDSYISNNYTLDQGYGNDMVMAQREQPIIAKKLLKLKGQEFLDTLEELASAITYNAEYAGPSEVREVMATIHRLKRELESKFGFTYEA